MQNGKMAGFANMLENVARAGLLAGDFEDSEDEGLEDTEEFYPGQHLRPQPPTARTDLAGETGNTIEGFGGIYQRQHSAPADGESDISVVWMRNPIFLLSVAEIAISTIPSRKKWGIRQLGCGLCEI